MTPSAVAPTPTNTKTPYTNWRPPLIGVSLFVPVDGDALLVAKTMGGIVLPVGGVREGQTVEHAAREVLPGGELPHLRRVFTDRRQMRRRAVVTHVLATAAMSQDETLPFAYRDPRGMLLILTIREAISRMPPRTRSRVELAALTLAGGTVRLPFPTPK